MSIPGYSPGPLAAPNSRTGGGLTLLAWLLVIAGLAIGGLVMFHVVDRAGCVGSCGEGDLRYGWDYPVSMATATIVAVVSFSGGLMMLWLRRWLAVVRTVKGAVQSGVFPQGAAPDIAGLVSLAGNLSNSDVVKQLMAGAGTTQTIDLRGLAGAQSQSIGQAVRGRARIDSVQDTGVKVQGMSLLVLGLTVDVDGQSFPARTVSMVPNEMASAAVVGADVEVMADPTNLSNLSVVWS